MSTRYSKHLFKTRVKTQCNALSLFQDGDGKDPYDFNNKVYLIKEKTKGVIKPRHFHFKIKLNVVSQDDMLDDITGDNQQFEYLLR